MHSRTNTGEVDSCSPGPGAYMPNIDAVKKRAPSASMHIRPKDKGSEETPGYVALPSTLQGPYWTIKGRENLDLIPV
ncbi:uncharacterized protein GO595_002634 [Histomonas meleagridis]|uniref:uncharacterized protein n=1 Tax=Histomonas meleagridis TaxID=135588 RepID=UPI00355996A7|nr:hypothetical protein GO595_002634 [Histomonas meleagridis]